MKLISSLFTIPKRGSVPSENEDFYFQHDAEISRDHQTVAIADGASEGFLSKLWSKILTVSYVNFDRTDLDIRQFTDFCIDVYEHQRERYVQRRTEKNNPLKWFEENLMAKGSFSTLLGVSFSNSTPEGGYWRSISVGDSCLFQIRESVIESFPMNDSSAFGNSPELISSNPAYNQDLESKVKVKTGSFLFGDSFYLMTDAVANWFITQNAEGKRPWAILEELLETDGLKDYVNHLRGEGSLKNDDVTIARVKLAED
ncbi:hypothetical protein A3K69_08530 [Candidatus Bathyarchaeota archaeon RBG_16_57_9]|nr:MAG: hypothetical protein A3K69_08530 [Candidatus Bathyarchaeota archaeon RBG_16_57_9]OGD54673.1 MAG: hypothetical protein A3K81_02045 [Candidatus Bathyarchaeota archaeon RBG_13_60_20]